MLSEVGDDWASRGDLLGGTWQAMGETAWPHPRLFLLLYRAIFPLLKPVEATTPKLDAVCLEVLFRFFSLFKLRET